MNGIEVIKMTIWGYCRISTQKQSMERQVTNILKEYPNAKILKEVFTGTTSKRDEWTKLIGTYNYEKGCYEKFSAKKGDKIIFDSVSRMSRNAQEGFKDYEVLFDRGVDLVFLKEPLINTETYKKALTNQIGMTNTKVDKILEGVNEFLKELAKEQIQLAFEQSAKEVNDLRERTKEGLREAKKRGKIGGRKTGANIVTKKSIRAKELIKKYSKDFDGDKSDKDVLADILKGEDKIDRTTFYRYKKQLFEEEME